MSAPGPGLWLRRALRIDLGRLRIHAPRPLDARLLQAPADGPAPRGGWPRISVVTPVRNQAAFIEQTLRSVLDQGYPALEYLVQDGASTDGTTRIIERHAHRLARFESRADAGQTAAINAAMRHASGELMAWLNGDDLLLPGALACVARYFDAHPQVDAAYGHRVLIDEHGFEIGRWVLPAHDDRILSWLDFVPQETLFWRRRAWERVGAALDESFRFAMDWDLLVRLRDSGARIARIDRFLGAFRVHAAQKTSEQLHDVGIEEMARIRRRCLGREPGRLRIAAAAAPYLLRHAVANWRRR